MNGADGINGSERDLTRVYKRLVEKYGNNFYGLSILQYKQVIGDLIHGHDAKTVLDYGSGRGDAYLPPHEVHKEWKIEVPFLFDPAYETHDVLPDGKFDAVLCSDVLEHLEEANAIELIRTLGAYADRFVWASVCCRKAKKFLPDGRNMHITIRPFDWWTAKFRAHITKVPFYLVETP